MLKFLFSLPYREGYGTAIDRAQAVLWALMAAYHKLEGAADHVAALRVATSMSDWQQGEQLAASDIASIQERRRQREVGRRREREEIESIPSGGGVSITD